MKYEIINMGETRMKVTSCRFLYHVYSEISTSNKSDLYNREIEATSHGICHMFWNTDFKKDQNVFYAIYHAMI